MTIYAVILNVSGAKWVDSQWCTKDRAEERANLVAEAFEQTRPLNTYLGAKVVPFNLEDARLAEGAA